MAASTSGIPANVSGSVDSRYAEQLRRKHRRRVIRDHQTDRNADGHERHPLPHDESHHAPARRAECQANGDLAAAQTDHERQNTVHPDRRQQHGNGAEASEHRRPESSRGGLPRQEIRYSASHDTVEGPGRLRSPRAAPQESNLRQARGDNIKT